MTEFIEANRSHKTLGAEIGILASAQEAMVQSAMTLLGWSQAGRVQLVPLVANRFLTMMSELALGWLLLEAGAIADTAMAKLSETDPDRAFYEGKKVSAIWYARNVLPGVEAKAKILALEDESAMQLPDAAFATV